MKRKDYSKITLSSQQIDAGEHKQHLGGGARYWDRRGAFQLALLQWLGLDRYDTLLDVGCGPLRGGIHFIKFLERGNYWGVDFNASFIEAAHRFVQAEHVPSASSHVLELNDFNFAKLHRTFDFILCFSVLNHCDDLERKLFFERIPTVMTKSTKLLVTHASWFRAQDFASSFLELKRSFSSETELATHLKFQDWGFDGPGDRLPILELCLADG